ncbi:hypothetical protein Gohar_013799, partial [Gossypium harknessii]|nr:hypothetical protein [Gossypium harknessii]
MEAKYFLDENKEPALLCVVWLKK